MAEKRRDTKGRVLKEGESQRKDGKYQYRFRDTSGDRRYIYAATLEELREKENDVERDRLDGIDYSKGKVTVSSLANKYIEQRVKLKKNTIEQYRALTKLLERYGVGNRQIYTIKKSDVVTMVTRMYRDGYKYKTIYAVRAFLYSVLEIAVEDDVLRKNPAKVKVSNYIEDNTKRVRALTDTQVESFLNFVKGSSTYRKYYDMYVILLGTGLRISEALGLTTDDVDFKNRCVHVTHQLQVDEDWKFYIESPKSKAGTRDIPISEEVRLAFKRAIDRRDNSKRHHPQHIIDGVTGFIFLDKNGKPMCGDGFDGITRRALRAYNSCHDEKLDITPHVFRHTFCTRLSNARVSPKTMMYVMGHGSYEMLAVYDDVQYDVVEQELRERVIGE